MKLKIDQCFYKNFHQITFFQLDVEFDALIHFLPTFLHVFSLLNFLSEGEGIASHLRILSFLTTNIPLSTLGVTNDLT